MQTTEIYDNLMNYTLPFALEHSDLEEQEMMDYLHDFFIHLQDHRLKSEGGGIYNLERLTKTHLSKFFFQYVVRAKHLEGQWVDRRRLGRRTQQEDKLGHDLSSYMPLPKTSYEMSLKNDLLMFLQSLDELEGSVLLQCLNGESILSVTKKHKVCHRTYYKVLNSLQVKARDAL